MSWQEQAAWTLAYVVLLTYIVVSIRRSLRRGVDSGGDLKAGTTPIDPATGLRPGTTPIDPATGLRSGTDVGIVHSMDLGGPLISAGQSVFQKGTRVEDRVGHPEKLPYVGSVLHYDASPGHEAAIVRWDDGMVTVELDVTTLAPVPMLSPLAGVVR